MDPQECLPPRPREEEQAPTPTHASKEPPRPREEEQAPTPTHASKEPQPGGAPCP